MKKEFFQNKFNHIINNNKKIIRKKCIAIHIRYTLILSIALKYIFLMLQTICINCIAIQCNTTCHINQDKLEYLNI